eukprot:UC1_evm2s1097
MSSSSSSNLRLTPFGVLGGGDEAAQAQAQAALLVLYGSQELTDKERKKVEKYEKFMAKKAAQAAKQAGGTGRGDKDKKKKKKAAAAGGGEAKDVVSAFVYKSVAVGDKPLTGADMNSAYDPTQVQDGWYAWWEKQGYFKPEYNESGDKIRLVDPNDDTFVIVIPPPNVTGTLHLGHALTNAIEDTLVRWNRMMGKKTLWNPGCDHAGIATQSVVEKRLWRDEKLKRTDLGREKFLERVWAWKESKGGRIYEQLKGLGASLDWDREAFTMAPRCCTAVSEAFIRLHEEGLIFRSNRLVNWSCKLNSAISDIEVESKTLTGRTLLKVPDYDEPVEFGVISSFAYVLEDGTELVVATTRPETMLGDVAVAVHPDDDRYKHLIGKQADHPFIPKRKIVVVADDILVDMSFGTGAVKITPAHDENDYNCGKRHNLPMISVIDKAGRITEGCGEFSGMKRFDARKAVLAALRDRGLFRGDADNPMAVPICSRSGDVIEPLSVPQWFCDCKAMAADAVRAVREGELKLVPKQFEATWFHWLENIRDWCISRQLWWGHRIPAYFITAKGVEPGLTTDNQYWVSDQTEAGARAKAAKRFGVPEADIELRQDEDVLDTWFSSGIFPISIFSWPEATADLSKYFPGHLLETGHDILFFWVARMVMMCKKLAGALPFKTVYLHSIVRDKEGRKMSKSLGNVVDPLDVCSGITLENLHETLKLGNLAESEIARAIEGQKRQFPKEGIPECGVDALRFALCALARQGKDINLDVLVIKGYRTFCNKIWNAVKFVLMQISGGAGGAGSGNDAAAYVPNASAVGTGITDRWILSRLAYAVSEVNRALEAYDFVAATTAIYNLWLYDFCGVYLEVSKAAVRDPARAAGTKEVLYTVCETGLRLLNPFMPFVTEELWHRLPLRRGPNDLVDPPSLCVAAYPIDASARDEAAEAYVAAAQDVYKAVNSIMGLAGLPANSKPEVVVHATSDAHLAKLKEVEEVISTLARTKKLTIELAGSARPEGATSQVTPSGEVFVVVRGLVDTAKELAKQNKLLAQEEKRLSGYEKAIAAEGFAKAPEAARAKKVADREACLARIKSIQAVRAMYEKLK